MLAFEIAHQVVAEGGEVAGLFLIDTRYPDRDAEAIERLRRRLVEQAAARVARRQLADGGGEAVPATERPGSGASSADNVTLLDDEEPNPRALQLYRYRPRPFPGRVTLFENEAWHRDHPATEWATVAAGGLEVEVVPGDHRTYLVDHLDVVADRLRTKLAAPVAPAAVG
ncbi:MAG: hypothetical protein AVDCRST_MAG59-4146 [uncultured Thermomicrobiales bacterium]|uniref:Thioesterase domain-containing protein n=1 Tax=uncultured Thermomicrobiales bacterium TaxID=1645740 RepID=A0A6J4VJY5_9BACT|nr:MAG: hypothetical protein AVDCRST_MAG59-4146 [uncultured Thermomicrobiales bacterium]